MKFKRTLAILSFLSLTACASTPAPMDKAALYRYQRSGAYAHDFAAAEAPAEAFLLTEAPRVHRPAIVLDIDETSLSNWPELAANDLNFRTDGACGRLPNGPCGLHAWELQARDAALSPTLHLYKVAKAHQIAVFFLTGRDETARAATARNLKRAGYNQGWTALLMRPVGTKTSSAADFKAPERAKIEAQGYTIVETVGDQYSDLAGGHAMAGFKVPNPFYTIP